MFSGRSIRSDGFLTDQCQDNGTDAEGAKADTEKVTVEASDVIL